jgi:DNA-binding NarL/FixJ family response regulator
MQQISCVAGDDQVATLEAEADLRVIGHARDDRELLELAERRHPDVTIVDSVACCRAITSRPDPPAVVVCSAHAAPEILQSALAAGALGFVAKNGSARALVSAVRAVHAGRPYIAAPTPTPLSEREREVLQRLAQGLTTDGIGRELFLSPATVRSYAEHAMRKLDAHNRVHAVAIALRLGLIS